MSFFNVSYNSLERTIPTSNQLQSFSAYAYEGNQKLCGAPLPNECAPKTGIHANNENNQEEEDEHEIPWFIFSFFSCDWFTAGFWGVCGPLMIKKRWRCAYIQFLDNVQDKTRSMR